MSSSGRRRTTDRHYSAEDQALDQISKEAEERIQARRQVRAEAREIRLREIERQQKEEEERQKPGADSSKTLSSYGGSRRGSDDSTDTDVSSRDGKESKDLLRDLKHSLREMEEKFRQAMVTNAQLENIKTSQIFQLELLKEQMEEKEEGMIEVQREYKDKCREYDFLKRDFNTMKLETEQYKHQLDVRDKLLKDSGLVIIASEEGEFSLTKCADMTDIPAGTSGTSLISEAAADLLKKAGEGTLAKVYLPMPDKTLRPESSEHEPVRSCDDSDISDFSDDSYPQRGDDKLKKIITERKSLQDEINTLSVKLEESRGKKENNTPKVVTLNGPEQQLYEVQREASKQIHEYKLKLQKAEQEITNLDGTVNRLETQVKRFKYDADEAEKLEDELKTERRRLQRELRECQNQIEELQNQNKHLNKRLEKIRQSRSTLMNP